MGIKGEEELKVPGVESSRGWKFQGLKVPRVESSKGWKFRNYLNKRLTSINPLKTVERSSFKGKLYLLCILSMRKPSMLAYLEASMEVIWWKRVYMRVSKFQMRKPSVLAYLEASMEVIWWKRVCMRVPKFQSYKVSNEEAFQASLLRS